jgi:hypothetical protein
MESFKKLGVNIVFSDTLGQKNIPQDAQVSELVKERKNWKEVLKELNFRPDVVFTHNENGEYGHTAHKLLSIVADDLFLNIWKFVYPKGNLSCKSDKKLVYLSPKILENKKFIFNDSYPTEEYLWRNLKDMMKYYFVRGPEIFTLGESN